MAVSPSASIEMARTLLGLTLEELWLEYVTLGGSLPSSDIGAFLAGTGELSDHDHDMVVHALNERFVDQAMDHPLAYAEDLPAD